MLVRLRQNQGKVIPADSERIKMDSVESNPKDIAVLIDGTNMSSAETFLLKAPLVKRSMKLPDDAIDNVGIPPDVRISDELKDKIQFIVDYYKKRASLVTTH